MARSRITAALAHVTVVVEAAARSGALTIAEHARALHRPVLALPGPVTSLTSVGCHTLLRDGHAELATTATDVLTHLDRRRSSTARSDHRTPAP